MGYRRSLVFFVVLLNTVAPLRAADAPLDPNLAYQARRQNPVTYDVEMVITVTAPYHTKVLKVWLPIPQSDAGQEITLDGEEYLILKEDDVLAIIEGQAKKKLAAIKGKTTKKRK